MPREPRPVPESPRSPVERRADLLAVAGAFTTFAVAAYGLIALENPVPTHFGVDGRPDGFGSKGVLLLLVLPLLTALPTMYALRSAPHLMSFPKRVTAENAAALHRLGRELLAVTGAGMAWVFALVGVGIVGTAQGWMGGLGPAMLPIVLVIGIGPTIPILVRMLRV